MNVQQQGFRYIVVGGSSNIILYLVYLGLTIVGMGHKLAMTLVYVLGVSLTYALNKNWTFAHRGYSGSVFFRYLISYGSCYLFQLSMLYLFVDRLGMYHAIVQAIAVVLVACLSFALQKYWVFGVTTMNAVGRTS